MHATTSSDESQILKLPEDTVNRSVARSFRIFDQLHARPSAEYAAYADWRQDRQGLRGNEELCTGLLALYAEQNTGGLARGFPSLQVFISTCWDFSMFRPCPCMCSLTFAACFTYLAHTCTDAAIIASGDAQFADGSLLVALEADGNLILTSPTALVGAGITVGQQANTNGELVVDGASFVGTGAPFSIGVEGSGKVDIVGGGRITSLSDGILLGSSESGHGVVTVSGQRSLLYVPSQPTIIGNGGSGEFVVEAGATALTNEVSIAGQASRRGPFGSGIATVRGAGSLWQVQGSLSVFDRLVIEDMATLTSHGGDGRSQSIIGTSNHAGSILVQDAGTYWLHSGGIALRNGKLIVRDGASAQIGFMTVNLQDTQNEGEVSAIQVSGPGTRLSLGRFEVNSQSSSAMTITDGGVLTTGQAGSFQNVRLTNTILIDGPGSKWVDYSALTEFAGSTLTISGAGRVTSNRVELSSPSEEDSTTVEISGIGSQWAVGELGIDEFTQVVLDGGRILSTTPIVPFSNQAIRNNGLIRGSGLISHMIVNEQYGALRVDNGNSLETDSIENQGGLIDVYRGELSTLRSLRNYNDGTLTLNGSRLKSGQSPVLQEPGLTNEGFVLAVGINEIYGSVANRSSGEFRTHNGRLTFHDGIENSGILEVSAGSNIRFDDDYLGRGIEGDGSVTFNGDFENIAITPTTILLENTSVTFGAASSLLIDFGPESHDRLEVAGRATLSGGGLELTAQAPLDDSELVEIIAAGSVDGMFASIPEIGEHLGFGVTFGGITYTSSSVVVSLVQQDGDFNLDGKVDSLDLDAWSAGFAITSGAELSEGDADRDGDVDGADFLLLQRSLLASTQPPSAQSVPEPSSVSLLLLAFALMVRRRA